MAVTIYKRKLANPNEWSLYLKINFNGQQWSKRTGLRSGKGKYKNIEAEKTARLIAQKTLVELVKDEYNISTKSRTFEEYYNEFIQLKSLEYQRKYLNMFEKLKHVIKPTIPLQKITTKHIKEFTEYCEIQEYSNSTINKDLTMLKSIFSAAMDDGMIRKNPFNSKFSYRRIDRVKSFLTKDELISIIELDINLVLSSYSNEYHRKASKVSFVRDMFLFQCFTGLRLSDIQTMDSKIDLHENRIIKTMQKTGKVISVPLSPLAKDIIEKYHTMIIPKISSQRYNSNLKKIVEFCQINKKVTSHTARHTFVTLLIASGVDIYTVQQMVGHGSVRTTELYAKLVDGKKEKAIAEFGKYLNVY